MISHSEPAKGLILGEIVRSGQKIETENGDAKAPCHRACRGKDVPNYRIHIHSHHHVGRSSERHDCRGIPFFESWQVLVPI
jgi:hypothetical protein